ncbi:hydroxyethylthiazole kinase [Siculibacillus lacustris]|uniref:Hydroxyethylthiazole kinase n=1 Tax=Siculibacillus lacustris TaxID=1549641 RepID=A0A4V2KTY6_9HYPH|nr:hydroxyethylthiazole kinase [Siculibacillus lacustris]TBW39235.1 hydroxyethylthiazole kinase [Siculibacillus lacustris]
MTTDPTSIPAIPAAASDVAAIGADVGRRLAALRLARPLVHNITNYVAMDLSANVLLAIGASPAMVHAIEEVEEFVAFSGALVINIGTLSAPWIDAMVAAAAAARRKGIPWVLDPVGAGATTLRDRAVARLMAEKPTVVRGNASEILAVAGAAGAAAKGVDSGNSSDEARAAAVALARASGAVVVVTGAVDVITDGTRLVALADGDPLMTRVTATGCALSAVVAAFLAGPSDAFAAAVAAVAVYGVAGRLAAFDADGGPATFRTAFVDRLARIGAEEVAFAVTVVP